MSKPVAIITGAAGGMGTATALRFAENYNLVLADVSEERLAALEKRLLQKGVSVEAQVVDVSEKKDIDRLAEAARHAGDLKALAHTAGISPGMATPERLVEVNLIGTALLLEALQAQMTDGAAAVCIASMGAYIYQPYVTPELNSLIEDPLQPEFLTKLKQMVGDEAFEQNAYSISKTGVQLLVQKYAGILGQNNARINSLSPGIIDTPMTRLDMPPGSPLDLAVKASPAGREGVADEIATTIGFLCSADSSYITGIDVLVDGGATRVAISQLGML